MSGGGPLVSGLKRKKRGAWGICENECLGQNKTVMVFGLAHVINEMGMVELWMYQDVSFASS